jgi:hypothetical protein
VALLPEPAAGDGGKLKRHIPVKTNWPGSPPLEVGMKTPLVAVLSIVVVFDALGWVFGVVPALKYALAHRDLPTVRGMRLLSGPFEVLGIDALIVAGLVFVVVSALKLLAAYWIWHARLDGAVLELILLGLSAIFWYGFALPFGPLVGVIEVILLALVWRSLG